MLISLMYENQDAMDAGPHDRRRQMDCQSTAHEADATIDHMIVTALT